MTQECKHEWYAINPFQHICCVCNQVANSPRLKNFSEREFQDIYSQYPQCGPTIFDDTPDLSK